MAKKKIKATKSKKQAQENRYFFGALLTVAGLLVVGIAAVVLFGGKGTLTSSGTCDQSSPISADVESRFGNKWRGLGATDWEYSPDLFKVYIDIAKWSKVSYDEEVKRANTIGKDFGDSMRKNGGDPKQANIMFHDTNSRDQMLGTYTGISGAQIQK